jgi:hypothetical protein
MSLNKDISSMKIKWNNMAGKPGCKNHFSFISLGQLKMIQEYAIPRDPAFEHPTDSASSTRLQLDIRGHVQKTAGFAVYTFMMIGELNI